MKRWTLDDIAWDSIQPHKVSDELLSVVKAAAVVEHNAADYAYYLRNVFSDDDYFRDMAGDWAEEEIQHGEALGRWAEKVDPGFSFDESFREFREGYKIPMDSTESIRGSRAGEMLARCIVETGTSSFYTAMARSSDEPVLKDIARRIAADEFRHYKTFYTMLNAYQERENVGFFERLKVALGRIREVDDDELAFAYHCANRPLPTYDHATCNRLYGARAYRLYPFNVVERAVGMVFKVVGLKPHGWLGRQAANLAWALLQRRARVA